MIARARCLSARLRPESLSRAFVAGTSRTEAELRAPGFGIKWYIALGAACRMYGVPTLAERDGSRPHTALFDAEMAGRLYFAMRGIRYREPVKRVLRRLH